MKVDLDATEERHLSLDEVRSTVSRALKLDPDFWESPGLDRSEVLKTVGEAKSVSQVWQAVMPLFGR